MSGALRSPRCIGLSSACLAPNGWVPEATAVLLPQATSLKEENRDHEPERPISPRENNS